MPLEDACRESFEPASSTIPVGGWPGSSLPHGMEMGRQLVPDRLRELFLRVMPEAPVRPQGGGGRAMPGTCGSAPGGARRSYRPGDPLKVSEEARVRSAGRSLKAPAARPWPWPWCSSSSNPPWPAGGRSPEPTRSKNAHEIAMIKRNQPAALPWPVAAVRHTAPSTGHGRHESRSTNTCGNARPEGCATGGRRHMLPRRTHTRFRLMIARTAGTAVAGAVAASAGPGGGGHQHPSGPGIIFESAGAVSSVG